MTRTTRLMRHVSAALRKREGVQLTEQGLHVYMDDEDFADIKSYFDAVRGTDTTPSVDYTVPWKKVTTLVDTDEGLHELETGLRVLLKYVQRLRKDGNPW
jgi:hypothetical protein